MNLGEIEATIYDSLNLESTSLQTSASARIRRYINLAYRQVMSTTGMAKLRRQVLPFSTIAGSPFATLPQVAVRIQGIVDRTNNHPLWEMALSNIRRDDPGLLASSSTPRFYDVMGMASPVTRDPSASGQCTAVSDAAGDTGATHTVYGEFVRGVGYPAIGSIALNGVTPVNIGPADSIQVQKFYTGSVAAIGNIVLKDGAGNELARIVAGRTSARYTRLMLYPTPSAVVVLHADVELHVETLANAQDEPLIPEDFGDVLVNGALYREYKKREKGPLYKAEYGEFRIRLGELRNFVLRPTGSATPRPEAFSQLGSNFPAGS